MRSARDDQWISVTILKPSVCVCVCVGELRTKAGYEAGVSHKPRRVLPPFGGLSWIVAVVSEEDGNLECNDNSNNSNNDDDDYDRQLDNNYSASYQATANCRLLIFGLVLLLLPSLLA